MAYHLAGQPAPPTSLADIPALLAAEITAVTGNEPWQHYLELATRPSGTDGIYKIYAESFTSAVHLQ